MEKFFYKRKLVGIRLKTLPKGTAPLTDPEGPLQVLSLKHSKGVYLKAHKHTPKPRSTERLQECLIVRKGKIKIDLYGAGDKHFKSVTLSAGDFFILLDGGYGIHILENAEIFEVKNGPFVEDKILI